MTLEKRVLKGAVVEIDSDVVIENNCLFCVHEIRHGVCKAFPLGIPKIILNGYHDHSIPLETQEDKSIIFKSIRSLQKVD